MPKNAITGLNVKFTSSFKVSCQSIFQSGRTTFYSQKGHVNNSASPHPAQYLLSSVFSSVCLVFGERLQHLQNLSSRPGIKSVLSARKVESSNHWTARESLNVSVFLGKKKKRLKWHTLMTLTTLGGCKWFSLVSLNFWPWIYAAFVTRKKKVTVLFKKLLGHSWHRTTSKHNKGSYRL